MLPQTEPTTLQAGDTLAWRVSLPAYPADDGWMLSYRLINADTRIDIVSTADADDPRRHAVQIAAAVSAQYAPGTYSLVRVVTRGAERYTLSQGEIRVLPDLAGADAPVDARSTARRALADLRAALARWLSSNGVVSEYEIAGRRMRFATAEDIRKRISLAENEVAREDAEQRLAAGLGGRRRVMVRF